MSLFKRHEFKIFSFIFLFLLVQRPFGLFEYSHFRLIKYIIFTIIIVFLIYYIVLDNKLIKTFIIPPEVILLIILLIYDTVYLRTYLLTFFLIILIISIYSLWLQNQSINNLKKLLTLYIYLSFLISLHGILQHLFVFQDFINIDLKPYTEYSLPTPFNIIVGSIISTENSTLRIASFFTEANRLAYFLAPASLLCFHLNIKYKKIICSTIFFGILLTFSFYGISILIISSLIVKNYRKYMLLIIFFLIIICVYLSIFNPHMLDKVTSFQNRIQSIMNLYEILEIYPGGMSNEEMSITEIIPTDTLFLHYAIRNGYFGLFIIILFSFTILRRTILLAKSNNSLVLILSASIFALYFYQLLMGNLFEFQFLLFCIISHCVLLRSHNFRNKMLYRTKKPMQY